MKKSISSISPETFFFSEKRKSLGTEAFNGCGDCFQGEDDDDSSDKRVFEKYQKGMININQNNPMSMSQLMRQRRLVR